jgi:hypothetical protein
MITVKFQKSGLESKWLEVSAAPPRAGSSY